MRVCVNKPKTLLVVPSRRGKATGVPGQAAIQPAASHASEGTFVTWFRAYKGVTRLRKLRSIPLRDGTAEMYFC